MPGQNGLGAQQLHHRRQIVGQAGETRRMSRSATTPSKLLDHVGHRLAAGGAQLRRDGILETGARRCHLVELGRGNGPPSRTARTDRRRSRAPDRLPDERTRRRELCRSSRMSCWRNSRTCWPPCTLMRSSSTSAWARSCSAIFSASWRASSITFAASALASSSALACSVSASATFFSASECSSSWVRTVSCWFFIMVRTGGTTYFQSRKTMTANPMSCPMKVDTALPPLSR